MSVVGFDIGNESCIVAVARQRGIDVVLNDESKRETPAVVCFGDKQRFIGTAGAASTMMNPKNSITQIKRLLGRRFNDPELQRDLETLPFTVVSSPDGFPLIHVNYRNEKRGFTPTQILAMILSDLKGIAEKNLNAPVVDCCIGVPVYFTDLQRRAVLDAATIAGLRPLRLFHETTATALGYGIYKSDLPEDDQMNVAFVDVGHASMQVCIAGFSNGQLKVLAHSYDRSLGGRDFDEVLFKHFAERFKDEYKIDVYQSPRACLRLRAACEKLKKVLSANPEAPLNIECLMDEKDVRGFIKREEFEQISSPILERVKVPLEKALAEAGLTVEDIHSIEVVGSGSRVPAIIGILRGFFGMEPRRTMNASECVARGCALQCAALSPAFRVRDFQVHESFPFPIALSWEGSILESQDGVEDIRHSAVVFPKGDPIPSTQFLTFYSCNSFSVNVMCTDLNGLNGPQIISKYSIGPVQTTKSEGAKFKVKVCLTIHGTVSVESATMLEEEIEVPVSVRHLLKNYTMLDTDEPVKYSGSQDSVDMHDAKYPTDDSSSGTENGPVPEDVPVQLGAAQSGSKIKAPEKKLKNINVPFTELVFGGMTPEEVCRAKEVELSMACQDRLMEETKDKKNAVEAYVYDMRNKLHSKYHDFIAAEEMQLFCKKLQGVEDWLYEEGEDETMEVYVLMLEELVKLGNPVEERYKNWADRDPAIQEFFDVVERFRKMAYCKIRRYDHIDMEERQKIVDVCEDAEKWLSEKIEIQSSLPKYAAPVLLAADVRREAKAVYRFCQSIMSKRKPPPVNQQIPLPTERQHPQPEDTAQQPPVGDGTGDPQSDASDVESEAASDPMDTESIKAEEGATDATLRQA